MPTIAETRGTTTIVSGRALGIAPAKRRIRVESVLPAALGSITGLLLGLTGAGGGIVAAPLLMLALHLSLPEAAPISLMAVALGAGVGMAIGLRQGIVRYRAALLMAGAGILASPLGIHLARLLPERLLTLLFAALLALIAQRQWNVHRRIQDDVLPCAIDADTGRFVWTRPCARTVAGAGLLAGFLSGLLGVGGGFILVPTLRRHTPLPMQSITATSLMVLTLVSLGGTAQWLAAGAVDWHVAIPFIGGTAVGMAAGRLLAPRTPDLLLQRAFAGLCAAICASLALKALLG